ncbi:gfo/Idh/MocA family oxidoreductase [Candidatus Poribacteria bacterium]|nr:MAG: gfo/Idh/MocA family oxidoreductase [Candidatus Poribacteria bacterium]
MPLRVAVVGLGFGRVFANIFKDHPDCELICVCDLHRDRAEEVAKETGAKRVAGELGEVLRMRDVDAVAIFTHAPRHAEHCIAALNAGKHVLCAVPAAITIEECEMLIEAVKRTGLTYANAETSYWRPETAQCRKWYREGRFGRIVYMEAQYVHDHSTLRGITSSPPEYGGKTWREAGFPPFLYITHSTGYILGVTGGRLVEVTAYPSRVPDDDVYTKDSYWGCDFANGVALFKTEDGVPVRIMEMRRVASGTEESFSIYGQNMSFIWPSTIYRRDERGMVVGPERWERNPLYAPLPEPLVKYTSGGHGGSHPYIVEDFVRAVLDERPPAVNVYEAVAFCAPGIIAHQSAMRDGERMRIPQFGRWGD